jgi:adenosylcobinamide-phosphate synthase
MLVPWLAGHAGPFSLFLVLLLALAFDAAFGALPRLPGWLPRPRVLIARSARSMPDLGPAHLRALALVLAWAAAGWLATRLLAVPFGWIGEALLAAALLGYRESYDAVRSLADAVARHLDAGRSAAARMGLSDPRTADADKLTRFGAAELADGFATRVAGPALWFGLLGLPGLAGYAAARAAGPVSPLPARAAAWPGTAVAALLIAGASLLVGGGNPLRALAAVRRAPAAAAESAMTGALGLENGPAALPDLKRALDLYVALGVVLAAAIFGCAVVP